MELLDISSDVIRQIMIYYIDNSRVNQKKILFIGSHILNEINKEINISEPELFKACENNDIINILELINEEDVKYVDDEGITPLMVACRFYMHEVALKISEYECNNKTSKNGESILLNASRNRMTDIILKIIETEHNVGQKDGYGDTALMYACSYKIPEVALKLLDMECNLEQVDNVGNTALYYATDRGMQEVIDKIERMKK